MLVNHREATNRQPHTPMTIRPLGLALVCLAVLLATAPADAQPSQTMSVKGARAILATVDDSVGGNGSALGLAALLSHPEKYSHATIDSLIDGVEQLALTSRSKFTRTTATVALANAAAADNPRPRTFDRLLALYHRTSDELVRRTVVHEMSYQRQQTQAIAFLKSVATASPKQQDFTQASVSAVSTLSRMGPVGRAALVELRDKNLLRDARAIGFVNWFLTTP
jgi:hypothetical protein